MGFELKRDNRNVHDPDICRPVDLVRASVPADEDEFQRTIS